MVKHFHYFRPMKFPSHSTAITKIKRMSLFITPIRLLLLFLSKRKPNKEIGQPKLYYQRKREQKREGGPNQSPKD